MRGADLYILQSHGSGDIKVGRSSDPRRRLREIQTGSPRRLRIILHAPGLGHREKEIHRRMLGRSTRTRGDGEWFEVGALAELPDALYELLGLEDEDWWNQ